jgi:hypothetical protein
MTRKFFADSDFLTGLMVRRDSRNGESNVIFKYLQEKGLISDLNDLYVSNYIIMEVTHNLFKKHEVPFRDVKRNYDNLMDCHVFHIKPKQIEEAFSTKLAPFCNHRSGNPPIVITDATSLVVLDLLRIGYFISFEGGFDTLPGRLFSRIYNKDIIDQKILTFCP